MKLNIDNYSLKKINIHRLRVTIFGQAKKRTQKLSVAYCTTLNGNVTELEKNLFRNQPEEQKPVSGVVGILLIYACPTNEKTKDGVKTLNSCTLCVIGLA